VTLARFIVPKLIGAVITLLLAITIAFFLARLSGDPVRNILGPFPTDEQVAAKRAQLGLDKPLPNQYVDYLGDLVRLDFGESLQYSRSNWEVISSRIWASVQLAAAALIIGNVIGLPLGVIAALKENTIWDRLSVSLSVIGQSMPLYWIGLIFILVFAVNLGWFPAGQSGSWEHLVLPAISLSFFPMARIARITRSSLTDVLDEGYIMSARARGLKEPTVIGTHALRNAALPVITIIGLQAGTLLSAAVTVEFVFGWPGLGTLAVQAVSFRDFTLVQALVAFGATTFVAINLAVDLLYGVVDPRIREAAK
jgi:peptide/nickel transport system permease protein